MSVRLSADWLRGTDLCPAAAVGGSAGAAGTAGLGGRGAGRGGGRSRTHPRRHWTPALGSIIGTGCVTGYCFTFQHLYRRKRDK